MRGAPWFRLSIIAGLLVLAGVPVWSLTREKSRAPEPAVPRTASSERRVDLRLESTRPVIVEISYAGTVICRSDAPIETLEKDVRLPAAQPADLVVHARWQDVQTERNALRVTASHDGDPLADATFWGEGAVDDVLFLPAP